MVIFSLGTPDFPPFGRAKFREIPCDSHGIHTAEKLYLDNPITLNQRVQGSCPCAPTNKNIVQPGDMGNGTYLRHG